MRKRLRNNEWMMSAMLAFFSSAILVPIGVYAWNDLAKATHLDGGALKALLEKLKWVKTPSGYINAKEKP